MQKIVVTASFITMLSVTAAPTAFAQKAPKPSKTQTVETRADGSVHRRVVKKSTVPVPNGQLSRSSDKLFITPPGEPEFLAESVYQRKYASDGGYLGPDVEIRKDMNRPDGSIYRTVKKTYIGHTIDGHKYKTTERLYVTNPGEPEFLAERSVQTAGTFPDEFDTTIVAKTMVTNVDGYARPVANKSGYSRPLRYDEALTKKTEHDVHQEIKLTRILADKESLLTISYNKPGRYIPASIEAYRNTHPGFYFTRNGARQMRKTFLVTVPFPGIFQTGEDSGKPVVKTVAINTSDSRWDIEGKLLKAQWSLIRNQQSRVTFKGYFAAVVATIQHWLP